MVTIFVGGLLFSSFVRSAITIVILPFAILCARAAHGSVISPVGVEVGFEWQASFKTSEKGPASTLGIKHARFIFGYVQNKEMAQDYYLDPRVVGVGGPRWPPSVRVLAEKRSNGVREITYKARGIFLFHKLAARRFLTMREATLTLPANIDTFYSQKCGDPEYPDRSQFWYVYDPFRPGCGFLERPPYANPVTIRFYPVKAAAAGTPVPLEKLWGDNGNGPLFDVVSISGFADEDAGKSDEGRVLFDETNKWFQSLGFKQTTLINKKEKILRVYEKDVVRLDGSKMHIRLTRLLTSTGLDEDTDKTYARFFIHAIKSADVLVYEGHSGMGANLALSNIAKVAGETVKFDNNKIQLFYFNACSSYGYYLGMFNERKAPGTLPVMTNALAADFTPPKNMMRIFYSTLFDVRHPNVTWFDWLNRMEKTLNHDTYLLSVEP